MSKRKKIVLLSIIIPLLFFSFVMIIIVILYSCMVKKEQEYYKNANWNVNRDIFYDEYYPNIKKYFDNNINDSNVIVTEEIEGKYLYKIKYENDFYQIDLIFNVFDNMCEFRCNAYIFYDSDNYKYEDIEFIDNTLSNFGKKTFFDYKINKSIILDIFDENSDKNPYNYYFDSGVGNLGCGWTFCKGEYLNFDSPYIFFIELNTLLKDSESFNQRLLYQEYF